jgi:hypothetical protein
MRAAGQGSRPRWDRPVVGRVRAARAAIAAALIGLLVLTFAGPGARARTWLAAGGVALVPYAYRAIEPQDAQVSSPDAVVDGYPAANAVDGTSSLSWAITWTDPAVPAKCGGSAAPALMIGFAEPSDLTRVILNPGLDQTDANRVRQVIPKVVDIESESGCERLTLAPTPGPQEFDVDLPDTSQVRVRIVDTEPPEKDAPIDNLLAGLSEIRFFAG